MSTGYIIGLIGLLLLMFSAALRKSLPFRWEFLVGAYGLILFLGGQYGGLFVAPPERMMGDVARILYVHVPAAWLAMLTYTLAFVGAVAYLLTGRDGWDWFTESATEVGTVLTGLLLALGAIFARPTWGVYWTWDPRLTSSAIMMITFVGVILLRTLITEPNRRALWSSVATILAFVNIPVTYLSVQWWRSMHQVQSTPKTMSEMYVLLLRVNAWAFLFLTVFFIVTRWRIAQAKAAADAPPPLPDIA